MEMKISRRRFLTSTTAGIALMNLQAGCTSLQTAASCRRFGPFRFGIQAHALRNFPTDGALSLEFEGNPKDPIAEINQCISVATRAAQKVDFS